MTALPDADRRVGRNAWRERVLAGKSREEISAVLGIGVEAVCRYERGDARIAPRELAALARLLGVPLSFLCLRDGQEATAKDASMRWIAAPRPLSSLTAPGFPEAGALLDQWRAAKGELTRELRYAASAGAIGRRLILVRSPARRSTLLTEHFGSGIAIMRPCESFCILESEFADHHRDAAYAAWVADAYAETLSRREPRLESVRAFIRMGPAASLLVRYDRLIIPWRAGTDRLAMALSMRRAAPRLMS